MGYFIYKYVENDEIIYIGKSTNSVENRAYGHNREEKFQDHKKAEVWWYECDSRNEMDVTEKVLIAKYRPMLNVVDKPVDKTAYPIKIAERKWKPLHPRSVKEIYAERCRERSSAKKDDFAITFEDLQKEAMENLRNTYENLLREVERKYATEIYCLKAQIEKLKDTKQY